MYGSEILIEKKMGSSYSTSESEIKIKYNDYQGGDAGHGGYLDIEIDFSKNSLDINPQKIKITSKGDWEKEAIVKALRFVTNALKHLEKKE